MPSPFPGMDPYLERPSLWVDFHNNLAPEIQAQLNQVIQPRYVARLTPYVTYEVIEIAEVQPIRPDVGVLRETGPGYGTQVDVAPADVAPTVGGVATGAPTVPLPVLSRVPSRVALELFSVEIRTVDRRQLVTAIEILSPVNKKPGHKAHTDYLRKRDHLLSSMTHLVEIDLLRAGQRPPLDRPVPAAPYYVTLSRAERRPQVEVWPVQLWDRLPAIPIPLRAPDADVSLDLAECVASVYDRAAYGADIDYASTPPAPPLGEAEGAWVAGWWRERGAEGSSTHAAIGTSLPVG